MVGLNVIQETPHWLVVNKSSGVNVERDWDFPSMEARVEAYLQQTGRRVSPFVGVVHRLDRPVSGALLFAKKKSTLRQLNLQFAERTVKKTYWAVVTGQPPARTGSLRHFLKKDKIQRRAWAYDEARKGAILSELKYSVLGQSNGRSLLEIQPLTGRYHQIRVQLSAIDCPIVGDEKYSSNSSDQENSIALHARGLQFSDPLSGQLVSVKAAMPNRIVWQEWEQARD